MPNHAPFGVFWGKNEKIGNVLWFCPSRNTITRDWQLMNQTAKKLFLRFGRGTRAKIGVTNKNKNHAIDNSPIWRDVPTWAIGLNFGMLCHIADVITHAKFCDNLFRGFGVLIPPILPFSIGIAGRPYNSLSTTMLHCCLLYTYRSRGIRTKTLDERPLDKRPQMIDWLS